MLVHQLCLILCDSMDCDPSGCSVHRDSPGKNTGVACNALLQGIFPIQGSNSGLLHCRQFLYPLRNQGSPRILAWVVYSFSQASSWPRNQTGVSCIAGWFFTNWAIREALHRIVEIIKWIHIKHLLCAWHTVSLCVNWVIEDFDQKVGQGWNKTKLYLSTYLSRFTPCHLLGLEVPYGKEAGMC